MWERELNSEQSMPFMSLKKEELMQELSFKSTEYREG